MSFNTDIKTYLYVLKLQRKNEFFYKIGISWKPELRQSKIKRQHKCTSSSIIYIDGFDNLYDARLVEANICNLYKDNVFFGKEYFKKLPNFIEKISLVKEALNV